MLFVFYFVYLMLNSYPGFHLLINLAYFLQMPSQAVQFLAQVDKHVSPFTLSPKERSVITVMEIIAFIDNKDH